MTQMPLTALAATLDVSTDELAAYATHDEQDLARLDALVRAAMDAEDRAFDDSLEDSLRFVPRLLRGTVRSALFPGGGRG